MLKATSAARVRVDVASRRKDGMSLDQHHLALQVRWHRGPPLSSSRLFLGLHSSQPCWLTSMQGLRGLSRPTMIPMHCELAPGDSNMRWQGFEHRPDGDWMPLCEMVSLDVKQQRLRAARPLA